MIRNGAVASTGVESVGCVVKRKREKRRYDVVLQSGQLVADVMNSEPNIKRSGSIGDEVTEVWRTVKEEGRCI